MKYGARNKLKGRITSIKSDEVMSQVKIEVTEAAEMSSVITTESLAELDLRKGDEVMLVVKAIHVLPVKE